MRFSETDFSDFSTEQRLEWLCYGVNKILEHLKIGNVKDIEIDSKVFMMDEWITENKNKMVPKVFRQRLSTITEYLDSIDNSITIENILQYLEESDSVNQWNKKLKALRPFVRDFLRGGTWIDQISFKKEETKLHTNELPTKTELMVVARQFESKEALLIFLLCYVSGLRISEVLQIKPNMIDFDLRVIDVSNAHVGTTKQSWFSCFTHEVLQFLDGFNGFSIGYKEFYDEFILITQNQGLDFKIKDLRLLWAEKCRESGIDKEYIDVFEGRMPRKILEKHYTSYSPKKLASVYEKLEPLLTLGL